MTTTLIVVPYIAASIILFLATTASLAAPLFRGHSSFLCHSHGTPRPPSGRSLLFSDVGASACNCWKTFDSFFACYWHIFFTGVFLSCLVFIARTVCIEWRDSVPKTSFDSLAVNERIAALLGIKPKKAVHDEEMASQPLSVSPDAANVHPFGGGGLDDEDDDVSILATHVVPPLRRVVPPADSLEGSERRYSTVMAHPSPVMHHSTSDPGPSSTTPRIPLTSRHTVPSARGTPRIPHVSADAVVSPRALPMRAREDRRASVVARTRDRRASTHQRPSIAALKEQEFVPVDPLLEVLARTRRSVVSTMASPRPRNMDDFETPPVAPVPFIPHDPFANSQTIFETVNPQSTTTVPPTETEVQVKPPTASQPSFVPPSDGSGSSDVAPQRIQNQHALEAMLQEFHSNAANRSSMARLPVAAPRFERPVQQSTTFTPVENPQPAVPLPTMEKSAPVAALEGEQALSFQAVWKAALAKRGIHETSAVNILSSTRGSAPASTANQFLPDPSQSVAEELRRFSGSVTEQQAQSMSRGNSFLVRAGSRAHVRNDAHSGPSTTMEVLQPPAPSAVGASPSVGVETNSPATSGPARPRVGGRTPGAQGQPGLRNVIGMGKRQILDRPSVDTSGRAPSSMSETQGRQRGRSIIEQPPALRR